MRASPCLLSSSRKDATAFLTSCASSTSGAVGRSSPPGQELLEVWHGKPFMFPECGLFLDWRPCHMICITVVHFIALHAS
ncbi:hypothetical protein KC326_g154 [Hortaea werneckii]|nr:hypothetical protein KC326_g154 [Hortaea werneckii]